MNATNDSGRVPFVAGLADNLQTGLFVWGSPEVFSGNFDGGDLSGWSSSQ